MLRYIEIIREEWSDTSKLHDTFPAVHDRNLVLRHQFFSGLLVIKPVGLRRTPCVRGIVKVYRFLP